MKKITLLNTILIVLILHTQTYRIGERKREREDDNDNNDSLLVTYCVLVYFTTLFNFHNHFPYLKLFLIQYTLTIFFPFLYLPSNIISLKEIKKKTIKQKMPKTKQKASKQRNKITWSPLCAGQLLLHMGVYAGVSLICQLTLYWGKNPGLPFAR